MTELYRETVLRLKNLTEGRELIGIIQAADILGVDKRTIIIHKLVPVRRIGSRYYVAISDMASYLSELKKGA